jgi:predicted kinase
MIFIMRGTSCSGKDTFISKHFPVEHTVLSSDKIRLMLMNNCTDQTKNQIVFDLLRNILRTRTEMGVPFTVVNATNLKYKDCRGYVELANEYHQDVTVISIRPPSVEELYERSLLRSQSGGLFVPKEALERHHKSYFDSLESFKDRANAGEFTFIEIDQDYEVIDDKCL